jgi:hypothetical protein
MLHIRSVVMVCALNVFAPTLAADCCKECGGGFWTDWQPRPDPSCGTLQCLVVTCAWANEFSPPCGFGDDYPCNGGPYNDDCNNWLPCF